MLRINDFKNKPTETVISELCEFATNREIEIDFSECDLEKRDLEELQEIFKQLPTCTVDLNLSHNTLYAKYGIRISKLFQTIPKSVRYLNLKNNPIPLKSEALTECSDILDQLPKGLNELCLCLDVNTLSSQVDVEKLRRAFAHLPENLEALQLQLVVTDGNHKNTAALLQKILAALSDRKLTLLLDLSCFPIQQQLERYFPSQQKITTHSIFSEHASQNITLTHVSFSGDTALSKLPLNAELRLLENLPKSVIGLSFAQRGLKKPKKASSYQAFFKALKNIKLEALNLNALHFTDTDKYKALREVVIAMPRTVKTLYFKDNQLGKLSVNQLKAIFACMSGITTLHLDGNNFAQCGFSTEQLVEIFSALPAETKVYGLDHEVGKLLTAHAIGLHVIYKDDSNKRATLLTTIRVACAFNTSTENVDDLLKPAALWLENQSPTQPQKTTPLSQQLTTALASQGSLFKDITPSYKQFYTDRDIKNFCKKLLEDYVKQDTFAGLIFSGHWNRHHVKLIKKVLADFDNCYTHPDKGNNTPDGFRAYIKNQITSPNNFNVTGSLARRLDACMRIHEINQTLSDSRTAHLAPTCK